MHRAGEGAPFTGLKPVLSAELDEQVRRRLAHAVALRSNGDDLASVRASTEAALGLQVWAHGVHKQIVRDPHRH